MVNVVGMAVFLWRLCFQYPQNIVAWQIVLMFELKVETKLLIVRNTIILCLNVI